MALLTLTLIMMFSAVGLTACNEPSECTHSGGTATCIAKAVCEKCGKEYGELASHSGGGATCENKAVCSTCNNEYGETLGHNYGAFISNGDGTYSKVCANDSTHKITENCSGGTATETNRAVCTTCNGECGSTLSHTHAFDKKVAKETYLKLSATCTEKAVYYYFCTCGEKGETTFESGEALSRSENITAKAVVVREETLLG